MIHRDRGRERQKERQIYVNTCIIHVLYIQRERERQSVYFSSLHPPQADSDEKDLVISHYHFTSWPDHGVPQFATSLISFIKRVQKDHNKDKNIPLLVHCSAGVGRTGTLVMLDIMMDRLKAEDSINVYEVLRQLRSKRMYMVQTQVSQSVTDI